MPTISVRKAQLSDAVAIAKIHIGTWQCAYRGQIPDEYLDALSVEARARTWRDRLAESNPSPQNFVAELDGRVVGFCGVGPCRDEDMDDHTGELWSIYIDAQFMGRGAGSALLETGLQYLRDRGYRRATLWVLTSNHQTRQWYQRRGWMADGKTKIDERDDFSLHETRYTKIL
jgi:ribosomal protein S18 acetylase RimI-like enzyme